MGSDSPRTDAVWASYTEDDFVQPLLEHARQLERELAAERERRKKVEAALRSKLLENAIEGNSSAAFKWSEKYSAEIERAKGDK